MTSCACATTLNRHCFKFHTLNILSLNVFPLALGLASGVQHPTFLVFILTMMEQPWRRGYYIQRTTPPSPLSHLFTILDPVFWRAVEYYFSTGNDKHRVLGLFRRSLQRTQDKILGRYIGIHNNSGICGHGKQPRALTIADKLSKSSVVPYEQTTVLPPRQIRQSSNIPVPL